MTSHLITLHFFGQLPLYGIPKVPLSADALRMRCRRLCEQKASGKYNIDAETTRQFAKGGESREQLEMALLECLAKHGIKRDAYKRVKVGNG